MAQSALQTYPIKSPTTLQALRGGYAATRHCGEKSKESDEKDAKIVRRQNTLSVFLLKIMGARLCSNERLSLVHPHV